MRYEFRVGYLNDDRLVVMVRNIDSCTIVGYLRSSLTINSSEEDIITGQINKANKLNEGQYNDIYCFVKALNEKFIGKIYTDSELRDKDILEIAQKFSF